MVVRVLVTVSPRMYREATALSLHQRRPHLEVRIAPPEAAEEEVKAFRPHLLVHNDTDGLNEEVRDISTDDLLHVADEVATLVRGA